MNNFYEYNEYEEYDAYDTCGQEYESEYDDYAQEADFGFKEERAPFPRNEVRSVILNHKVQHLSWEDEAFEQNISKVSVPKIISMPCPWGISPTVSSNNETAGRVPKLLVLGKSKKEKKEERVPSQCSILEEEKVPIKCFSWDSKQEKEVDDCFNCDKQEKEEKEENIDELIEWGIKQTNLKTLKKKGKKEKRIVTIEPEAEKIDEFPELGTIAVVETPPKPRWGKVSKFTKLDLVDIQKEPIVVKEAVSVDLEVKVPNLYLNKKKKREYCTVATRGHRCCIPNCTKAHDIEEYLPQRCNFEFHTCKARLEKMNMYLKKKISTVCDKKHTDESLEKFLLRVKIISSIMYHKLLEVQESNFQAFKMEKNKKAGRAPSTPITAPRVINNVVKISRPPRQFSSYLAAVKEDLPEVQEEIQPAIPKKIKREIVWEDEEIPYQESERDQAFATLADTKGFSKNWLSKTKLCLHYQKNGVCPRRDKCGFAHGKEELRKASCVFGKTCNKADCKFLHPGDIQESKKEIPRKNDYRAPTVPTDVKETKPTPSKTASYPKYQNENRNKAFEVLSDPNKIKSTLSKTKLCSHYQKKGVCSRGDKCGFAHSKEELRKVDCFFGIKCNKPNCSFSHPKN